MTRQIKFRARRNDNGAWVYGHYFKTPLTDENSGTTTDKGLFFLWGETRHCIEQNNVAFVVDETTLGQFTGLHDKNGKKIYEGDIVRGLPIGYSGEGRGEVVFKNASFIVNCGLAGDHGLWDGFFGATEVIGNIYENPELLSSS